MQENENGTGDGIAPITILLPYSSFKEGSLAIEETDTNIKSLIEYDLRGSDNEFGTKNSKTSNGKGTPEKHEKVPMFFPHFQNDYEKEGVSDFNCLFGLSILKQRWEAMKKICIFPP